MFLMFIMHMKVLKLNKILKELPYCSPQGVYQFIFQPTEGSLFSTSFAAFIVDFF